MKRKLEVLGAVRADRAWLPPRCAHAAFSHGSPRPGPPQRAIRARRGAARRDRRHQPDARGAGVNLRVRVAPPEAYRAAGVDYNPVLPGTHGRRCSSAPTAALPRPPRQRPRRAGALRRRRSSRSPGPPAAWCANTRCCSIRRRRSARRRLRRRRGTTTAPVISARTARATPLPPAACAAPSARSNAQPPRASSARARCRATPSAGRQEQQAVARARRRAASRARRRLSASTNTGCSPATRCRSIAGAHAAPGRLARPDAGVAVPRQPAAPSSATT